MKLFISGPMRGVPRYNFPAFDAAKAAFEAVGFDVITPADLDRAIGFDAMTLPADTDWNAEAGFDVKAAMLRNITELLKCDGNIRLDGESLGADIEAAIAWRCHMFHWRQGGVPIAELVQYVQKNWTDSNGKGEA